MRLGAVFRSKRAIAWLLVSAMFASSLALAGISAVNYTEIAKARMLTSFRMDTSPSLVFNGTGGLESVTLHVNFSIHNPSSKELRVWVLAFKAWLRDPGMGSGADAGRRLEDISVYAGGEALWYLPVTYTSFSYDIPRKMLPGHANITVTETVTLTRTTDPEVMGAMAAILNDTGGTGNTTAGTGWVFYGAGTLFVEDMPQYAGPDKTANVIKVYQGTDLGSVGVGG